MTGLRTLEPGARGRMTLLSAAATGVPAAVLTVLVLTGSAALLAVDDAVTGAADRLSVDHPSVAATAGVLTRLGDPLLMTSAALLAALVLLRRGDRRLALLVLVVRAVSAVLSNGGKALVDRPRPAFAEPVAMAQGASFPSGHALGSAAVWSVLAVVLLLHVPAGRTLWLTLGVGVPVLVAATRVLIGVHYLSDVVAGLLLGSGTTAVAGLLFIRRVP